jgi:Holliday junction resolvase RusA-like endonuclease
VTLTIRIPGPPVAQGRPRAFQRGGKVRMYDPKTSREWKARARTQFNFAVYRAGLRPPAFRGPVLVSIGAFFACPKSVKSLATKAKTSRPDCDNIGKAVLDSGNEILFTDDAQVVELHVSKWVCYSGQEPFVEVTVRELEAE